MNTEQVKKWWRLPNTDRLIDVSREQPDGCWESEESGGRCHYDKETATIHFGESMVYGAHHHYPCGKPDVDADMLREIEDRKVQWKAMWESAEDFPFPVSKIYLCDSLVWEKDEKEQGVKELAALFKEEIDANCSNCDKNEVCLFPCSDVSNLVAAWLEEGISQESEDCNTKMFVHSPCCNAHWELVVNAETGELGLQCEECNKPLNIRIADRLPPEKCNCGNCGKEELFS